MFVRFVNAAVECHTSLGCNITHKVHLMWKHVAWQMRNIPGGLGGKMEDWVERMHQWGMRFRRRLRTVKDPLVRAKARSKVLHRDTNPEVMARDDMVQDAAKRHFKHQKVLKEKLRKEEREKRRLAALLDYEANKM